MAGRALAKLLGAVLSVLADDDLGSHCSASLQGETTLLLKWLECLRRQLPGKIMDGFRAVRQFAVFGVHIPMVQRIAFVVELHHRGMIFAVPVLVVLLICGEAGQVDFQC